MASLLKPNLLLHSIGLLVLGILVGLLSMSFAGASAGSFDPASIDSGDTAWMLVSSALVMLMIPAVGFFYAGMVRSKNVISVLKHSVVILSLVTLQWVLVGYSLVFGKDINGLIGDLSYFGLRGVGFAPNADYAATIPHLVFMVFQGMFAIITPALIIGSFVERIKFKTLVIFTLLWATLVYDPIAHWVWGVGGFLRNQGALDFAGGTVVHISAGFSAIAAAWLVGRREDHKTAHPATSANNVPFVILGAALLWFGWFGFNAGSALASGPLAASAFVVTNIAAAAAALTWMTLSWSQNKKPSAMGTVTGAVCGLVAITPASGFVGPVAAIAIGIIAGVVTYLALFFRSTKTSIDDTLDVWAAHGIGGVTGAILTGIFAEKAINELGANGLLFGNPAQLGVQISAVLITAGYAFFATLILLKVINYFSDLRVSKAEEKQGLDMAVHGEAGYRL
ncbi:MAG TPA: ammonium transporter [Patescibacteria group bacterium]|nr:ammonium transporter [Patescibacteria group bacterium]